MSQQFTGSSQVKTRVSVVVFLKCSAAPVAIYTGKPQEDYAELQQLLQGGVPIASNKFFERDNMLGPVKKISFPAHQIAAIAMQEEQYV